MVDDILRKVDLNKVCIYIQEMFGRTVRCEQIHVLPTLGTYFVKSRHVRELYLSYAL